MPKISIIISSDSSNENIKDCLDSLLSQSFYDFEVICVSVEESKIFSEYMSKDSRVKFVPVSNYSSSITSINKAVKYASSQYIMIVESMMLFKENALLNLSSEIENNYDIVFFNTKDFNDINNFYLSIPVYNINRDYVIEDKKEAIKRLLALDLYSSVSNYIVKKSLYEMLNLENSEVTFFKNYFVTCQLLYNASIVKCLSKLYYSNEMDLKNKKNIHYKISSSEETRILNDIACINSSFFKFLKEIKLYNSLVKEVEYYEYINLTFLNYKINTYKNIKNIAQFENTFIETKKYNDIANDVYATLKEDDSIAISIIIPVYNTEHYLKKCIDSIINQSFKNLEIIIVDDFSKGNAREIVESYKNNSIKYLRNECNIGSGWSRINGLKLARGKYIHFVDSDDYLVDESYKKIIHYLDNKFDALYFNNYIINNEAVIKGYHATKNDTLNGKMLAFDDMFFNPSERGRTLWSRVFSRKCCIKAIVHMPKYNISMSEDWIYNLFILSYVKKYRSVNDVFYYYNKMNPDAITNLSDLESKIWIDKVESLITQYFIACNSLIIFFVSKNIWKHYRSNWVVYLSVDLKYHFIDIFQKFEENILDIENNEDKVVCEFSRFLESRVKPSFILSFIRHNTYISNNLSTYKNIKYAFSNMIYNFLATIKRPRDLFSYFFSMINADDKIYIKLFGFQITFLRNK